MTEEQQEHRRAIESLGVFLAFLKSYDVVEYEGPAGALENKIRVKFGPPAIPERAMLAQPEEAAAEPKADEPAKDDPDLYAAVGG